MATSTGILISKPSSSTINKTLDGGVRVDDMMRPSSSEAEPSVTGNSPSPVLQMKPAAAFSNLQMRGEEREEEMLRMKPEIQAPMMAANGDDNPGHTPKIQAKLQVGASDNVSETEADAVADQVVKNGPFDQVNNAGSEDITNTNNAPAIPKFSLIQSQNLIQKQDETTSSPAMHVRGDAVRKSPDGGVSIQNGAIEWKLLFKGDVLSTSTRGGNLAIHLGMDVIFTAKFTPSQSSTCPRITFVQSVLATTGGVLDTGHLLYTSDAQGRSMDVSHGDTEPYYGAGGRPSGAGTGLQGDVGQQIGGGSSRREATHGDGPYIHRVPPGEIAQRNFEAAVICIETGETYGSISWGYRKHGDGTVQLLGARMNDLNATGATSTLENVRQAYYQGAFQHSIHSFSRGSSTLSRSHRQELDTIPTSNLQRIVLIGANDNSGGPENRSALSLARAQRVKNYLVRRGISATIITIEGHGVAARYQNPTGQQEPRNRRVDVRYERGTEQGSIRAPGPDNATTASPRELRRIRRQNPWFTAAEAVRLIVQLDSAQVVTMPEWVELLEMLGALQRWRTTDATVPDIRTTHAAAIRRIRRKLRGSNIPRIRPGYSPRPIQTPNLIDRIGNDATNL